MKHGVLIGPEALETENVTAHGPGVPMVLLGEHALDVPIDHVGIDKRAGGAPRRAAPGGHPAAGASR